MFERYVEPSLEDEKEKINEYLDKINAQLSSKHKHPVVTSPQPIIHPIHNEIVWMISKFGVQLVTAVQRDHMRDFGQIFITVENYQ